MWGCPRIRDDLALVARAALFAMVFQVRVLRCDELWVTSSGWAPTIICK
jgi:hypothetical protein